MHTRDDVIEAVFRHQIDYCRPAAGSEAAQYFLSIGRGPADPQPEFVARFVNQTPPVLPVSRAGFQAPDGIARALADGNGRLFRVIDVKMLGAKKARVTGGIVDPGSAATERVYTVEKRGGRWEVVDDRAGGSA
jgi:hypothetical protein